MGAEVEDCIGPDHQTGATVGAPLSVPPAPPPGITRWKNRAAAQAAQAEGLGRLLAELQGGRKLHGTCLSTAVVVDVGSHQAALLEKACFGRPVAGEPASRNSAAASPSGNATGGEGPEGHSLLMLSFEEAFFLSYAAGCLLLFGQQREGAGGALLSEGDTWRLFAARAPAFPRAYVAYHHLRAKRWVVRPGIQYGADFMAYRHHPAHVHSDYAVLVLEEGGGGSRVSTWTDVHAMARLCNTVAKSLLLLVVGFQGDRSGRSANLASPACLELAHVQEIEVQRWLPERHREPHPPAVGPLPPHGGSATRPTKSGGPGGKKPRGKGEKPAAAHPVNG